jgi:hypothetical protein
MAMLQVIFGDDEHTAADGPYVRVLKTRKWLYILSILALTISFDLYDDQAAKEILQFVRLPSKVMAVSVTSGLTYLSIQYVLLLMQLWTTYDIVLDERLTFRRADELAAATEQEQIARDALKNAKNNIVSQDIIDLQDEIQKIGKDRQALLTDIIELTRKKRHSVYNEEHSYMYEIILKKRREIEILEETEIRKKTDLSVHRSELVKSKDPEVTAATQKLEIASSTRLRLVKQVPSARAGYIAIEKLIDYARIMPPILLSMYAILELLLK